MYVCPSCHLEQATQDGFCRDCGTQVVALRYCDSCGVETRGAEGFCRECGTRLPEVVPFTLKVAPPDTNTPAPAPPPVVPLSDTPAWLKGNEPEPSRRTPPVATMTRPPADTPDWLRGNPPRVDDNILMPRPTPTPRQTVRQTTPSGTVIMRRPVPTTDSRTRNLQALLGLLFAVLGVITAANSSAFVIGLALIVVAMVVGGKPLFELSTAALHRIIDWIWDDPVLRKRMLDE